MTIKKLFTVVLTAAALALGTQAAHAQQVPLGDAIRWTAGAFTTSAQGGERQIAVLAIQSDYARMSNHIIDEMAFALTGRSRFTVMNRTHVAAELPIDTTARIDQSRAQSVGRFIGAQYVIVGEISPLAGFFRLRTQLIDVESGVIRGTQTVDVRNDSLVAYLRGVGAATPAQAAAAAPATPAAQPARPPQAQQAQRAPRQRNTRANWFSGEIAGTTGGGGAALSLLYENNLSDFFSMGGAAFVMTGGGFGLSMSSRLFMGPVYLELGLGVGSMRVRQTQWIGGWPVQTMVRNTGFLMSPGAGLRLGGRAGGFFGTPFVRVPIVVGSNGVNSRFVPGIGFGGAW